MRDELPSGLVLPPGVRAGDLAVVERRPALRLSPRVAALRADVKGEGPMLARYYRERKAWR